MRLRAIKQDHLTWNTTTGLAVGMTFQLSDISYPKGYYDYYKIKKVVVQLWPEFTNVAQNTDKHKIIYGSTVVDYDDATISTSTTDPYKDYSTRKMLLAHKPHVRIFTPRPAIEIFKSSSTSNYGFLNANVSPWLNTVHDSIPHYGFKLWMPGDSQCAGAIGFKTITKYYVLLRNRI